MPRTKVPDRIELSLAEQQALTRARGALERAQRTYGALGASVLRTRGVDADQETYVEERRADGVAVALARVERRPGEA